MNNLGPKQKGEGAPLAVRRQPYDHDRLFQYSHVHKIPFVGRCAPTFHLDSHKASLFYVVNNEPAGVGTKFHFTINPSGIFKIFKESKILFLSRKKGEGGSLYLHLQLWPFATNWQWFPESPIPTSAPPGPVALGRLANLVVQQQH